MDLHYCENILKIAEMKSITKAAKQLFITQSALNQQLEKLELELGTPLFERNRSNWQLTKAGEIYIDATRTLLQIKKNAYNRINDIAEVKRRLIHIGLIPERGVDMFTAVYPEFHQLYPHIILNPIETNVLNMQKQISSGLIDLGLMTLNPYQRDDNTYIHMADEEIFLAIPASHPLAAAGSRESDDAAEISLNHFSQEGFILIFQDSTMHSIEQSLFDNAGFDPHILFSTASNISKHRMVAAGVGCAILPRNFAVADDNIRFFRLMERPEWEITMCYRKGAYINNAERTFLNLCKNYWNPSNEQKNKSDINRMLQN